MVNSGASTFLAHSKNDEGNGVAELLRDHLLFVAERTAEFSAVFDAEQQGHAAGLLHDLGKYGARFFRHLEDPSERAGDHWSAGAVLLAALSPRFGLIPALAVAGHHAGLTEIPLDTRAFCRAILDGLKNRSGDFTESDRALLWQRFEKDGLRLHKITRGLVPQGEGHFAADMLDVRMLFSALVDADFLETEAHFNGDAEIPRRPRPDGPTFDVDRAIAALNRHLDRVRRLFRHSPMASSRDNLFEQCVEAASRSTGPFSLSAPTGAAKTLAMIAFALHHARAHNLRRVVLVIPFLNIIEQTAQVYRSIFSPENGFDAHTVIEHHSLADSGDWDTSGRSGDEYETLSRLLAENWDAPIVLTTSVQFFESLMAARPARCRKLHRLARSVVLFDEVQTLPVKLAVATLAALSRLTDPDGPFRSTVVFATATQPAFDALDGRVRREFASFGWRPAEIAADPQRLYTTASDRVHVSWRYHEPIDLELLAQELMRHERMLCIVNLKRHATQLATTLAEHNVEGLTHLSTNMCPAHRTAVLDMVRRRLADQLPVRLVATQCVEAGVDIDFPVVYRALAPLEAIAQAAGRCNRHGQNVTGRVTVFKPQDDRGLYPPGYKEAVMATETFLNAKAMDGPLDDTEILNSPKALRDYFRQLYDLSGRTATEREDERELLDEIRAGNFAEVARLYRLIKQDSINVLVPYDADVFNDLKRQIAEAERLKPALIRDWIRRATAHAVSLIRPDSNGPLWNHLEPVPFSRRHPLENYEANWFFALSGLEYDRLTGLSPPDDNLLIL